MSERAATTRGELILGTVLAAAGIVTMALTLSRDQNALQVMSPGVDGSTTSVIAGAVLPLLGGVRYRGAVIVAAALFAVQAVAHQAADAPIVPSLGIELFVIGLLAFPGSMSERRSAADRGERPAAPEGGDRLADSAARHA